MIRAAVGIMVHNEVHNLPGLLDSVRGACTPGFQLDSIVVVSSGSTDGSDDAVREAAARDPRIRLLSEPSRRGKARAINRFLQALPPDVERCVLLSGDVLPAPGAVGHLLTPLDQPDVGMTGARVVPTNPRRGWIHPIVHVLWALHHQVASRRPKLGEMVAFRANIGPIDPTTPVDEASIEAAVTQLGQRLAYVPAAHVYNHGPTTLRELLAQRQRIWAGHVWLRRTTGYRVSTYRIRDLALPVLSWVARRPHLLPLLVVTGLIELCARISGGTRYRVLGRPPTIWPVLHTTKAVIRPH